MFRMFRYFLWLLVILAMILSFDQLMLSLPMKMAGLKETQQFYVDFRQRLFNLLEQPASEHSARPPVKPGKSPAGGDSIAGVIRQRTVPTTPEKNSRYLYVDNDGNLQFADSFDQVPSRYRASAQRLAE